MLPSFKFTFGEVSVVIIFSWNQPGFSLVSWNDRLTFSRLFRIVYFSPICISLRCLRIEIIIIIPINDDY